MVSCIHKRSIYVYVLAYSVSMSSHKFVFFFFFFFFLINCIEPIKETVEVDCKHGNVKCTQSISMTMATN